MNTTEALLIVRAQLRERPTRDEALEAMHAAIEHYELIGSCGGKLNVEAILDAVLAKRKEAPDDH